MIESKVSPPCRPVHPTKWHVTKRICSKHIRREDLNEKGSAAYLFDANSEVVREQEPLPLNLEKLNEKWTRV